MNSKSKGNTPKIASNLKKLPTYIVAYSFNEDTGKITKVEQHSETLNIDNDKNDADVSFIESENASNSTMITSINVIIHEVIDKVFDIQNGKKIEQITELNNLEVTNDAKHLYKVLSNNNSIFEDMSPSTTSTDTIRNHSDTDTIYNKDDSELLENASNTTLKDRIINRDPPISDIPITNKTYFVNNDNEQLANELDKKSSNQMNVNYISKNHQLDEINLNTSVSQNICDLKSNENIALKQELTVTPYKTEVINIALAQVGKHSVTTKNEKIPPFNENNTTTDTFMKDKTPANRVIYEQDLISKESDGTLIGSVLSELSSRVDYFLANTGSSINKTDDSVYSLTSRSENCYSTDEKEEQKMPSKDHNTVIVTNVLPSTSRVDQYNITNNITLLDEMHKLYPLKSKGDNQTMNKSPKNTLKKSFEVEKTENFQKSIILPNEATIKEILTEKDNLQKISCSEESRNFQPFPDMWDKITVTLDLAIKRIEESLSEKILSEVKNTMQKLEHFAHQILNQKANEPVCDLSTIENASEFNSDEGMQCNLIQSYVIDNLMFKLSEEGSERTAKTKILKIRHPKLIKYTFEVLKSYTRPALPIGEGDSIKVESSEEGVSVSSEPRRRILLRPLRFLKENTVVLGSVPAFFVYMLIIYGFIVLAVKV